MKKKYTSDEIIDIIEKYIKDSSISKTEKEAFYSILRVCILPHPGIHIGIERNKEYICESLGLNTRTKNKDEIIDIIKFLL